MTPVSSLDIRSVSAEEYGAFSRVPEFAFGENVDDEAREFEREFLELDRTLAAVDGKDIVASAAAFSFEMTVPGGTMPAAGVSWVAVLSTHRRRGVLASVMRRQLDDVLAAGREPVAILWASEPPIYGRFGYGLASTSLSLTVPRVSNALRPVRGGDEISLRFVETDESVDLCHPAYEHDRARRPGMLNRYGPWLRAPLFIPRSRRGNASPIRTVLAEGSEGVRGFARYVTQSKWTDVMPVGSVEVRQLHAIDSAAAWALWRHVTDVDLFAETVIRNRPTDDPLLTLLVNPRAARPIWGDGLYLRLIDVGDALSRRTYATPVDVVIDVADAFCPWNTGTWRLTGDASGGRCERSGAAANIRLDVRELGAAYLGGTSLWALADAGLVDEFSPGAVGELSLAMRHEPAPWSSFVF